MKLAEFLAEYVLKAEADNDDRTMDEVIQQGIEAFCSTEDATIWVMETAATVEDVRKKNMVREAFSRSMHP